MAQVSSDVLWMNLRKDNAFIVGKKGGLKFSTDPYNLLKVHTAKHAGIASNSGIGIERRSKKELLLRIKKLRKYAKGKTGHETTIKLKGAVAGKGHKVIGKKCEELRPDLLQTAMQRCKVLHEADITNKKPSQKNNYFTN